MSDQNDQGDHPAAAPAGRRLWVKALAVLGLGTALALLLLLGAVAILYPQLPDTGSLAHYQPKLPLRVYTADGVEIGGFGNERRQYLHIGEIPKLMRDSLLAVEDSRFYEHHGIDPVGVLRAVVANVTGGRTQGASTITQQVARTFFLTREKTLSRKLKEALLSLKMEHELSKDQILELYMNQIYLGARAYGFAEAAQTYFGKPLAALSPAECAMLAGLPQNPANVNPIRNPERAHARQLVALWRMREQGVIDEAGYEAAKAQKLVVRAPGDVEVHAEFVAEMARAQVVARYGEEAYSNGLKVITTLRAAEQQAAYKAIHRTLVQRELQQPWRGPEDEEDLDDSLQDTDPAVSQQLADYNDDETLRAAIVTKVSAKRVVAVLASGEVVTVSGRGLRQAQPGLAPRAKDNVRITRGSVVRLYQQGKDWLLTQWPQAEGAMVALNPNDGEIHALVGGFDFRANQFNHVTQGWRQPGSAYKPFLYAAAMENGVMPETIVNDAPLTGLGDWNPQNADGSADGPITLRQALARSKNLVSIRLVQLLGPQAARDWTGRYGFDVSKQPDNLTLALGAGATTPLQLAGAYAVIANGGLKVNPLVIRRITDAQGKVLFEAPPATPDESQRVIPARSAYITASLLQEVTRTGTAARAQAQLKRPDLFGKTGTTNDVVDAWFAGFQPRLVAVVWLGYDKPQTLGSHSSGASLALPAWIQFMSTALAHEPVRELAVPEGLVHDSGDWRYAEWADGGFIQTLGLDDQVIDRTLIPIPGEPAASKPAETSPEQSLFPDIHP